VLLRKGSRRGAALTPAAHQVEHGGSSVVRCRHISALRHQNDCPDASAKDGIHRTVTWKLLIDAGFERPDCRAEYPIGGGADSVYYEWITESFRSIQPRAIAQGIIAEGEVDVETLEGRLRVEGTAGNSCCPAPAMIAAFARLRV
jgi:hypothetical protein